MIPGRAWRHARRPPPGRRRAPRARSPPCAPRPSAIAARPRASRSTWSTTRSETPRRRARPRSTSGSPRRRSRAPARRARCRAAPATTRVTMAARRTDIAMLFVRCARRHQPPPRRVGRRGRRRAGASTCSSASSVTSRDRPDRARRHRRAPGAMRRRRRRSPTALIAGDRARARRAARARSSTRAGCTCCPAALDPHVHFNEPGRTHWEGLATGTAALAAGGVTAFFDMPLNSHPPTIDGAAFDAKVAARASRACVDFGLWGGLVPGNLDRLEELAERGVVGFKAFMSDCGIDEFARADDVDAPRGHGSAPPRSGSLVAVHAENDALTARAARRRARATSCRLAAAGRAELEAIERALAFARGDRLRAAHRPRLHRRRRRAGRRGARARRRRDLRDLPALPVRSRQDDVERARRGRQVRAAGARRAEPSALWRAGARRADRHARLRPLALPAGPEGRRVRQRVGRDRRLPDDAARCCSPRATAPRARARPRSPARRPRAAERFGLPARAGSSSAPTPTSRWSTSAPSHARRRGPALPPPISPFVGRRLRARVVRTLLRGADPAASRTAALLTPTDERIPHERPEDHRRPVLLHGRAGDASARRRPSRPSSACCRSTRKIIHVRWSGESAWIPLGDLDIGLDAPENATSHPAPARSSGTPAASARPRSCSRTAARCREHRRPARRQPLPDHRRGRRPAARPRRAACCGRARWTSCSRRNLHTARCAGSARGPHRPLRCGATGGLSG